MPLRKAFIFRGGDRIEEGDKALNYLDSSVEKLKATLQEYGNWEVDDFVLKSSDDISDRLDGIEDSKENEILIFYVGHGLYKDKTKKYYLIGQNCKNIILDNIISPIKEPHYTRFTLIIDACYSNEAIKFVPKAENIDMLTSVFDGKAYENDDFEATSFVHHFCESIIGTDLAQDKPIYLDYICNKIFENEDEKQKPILSPNLHTQYTNQIIIAKSKKKNFIPSVIKANAKYIKRDIDTKISQKIDTQTKELIIINAEGGFGKSTLLQNLIFEYSTTPMILIATQNIHNTTFVDLLLDDDLSVIQNCSRVNTIKARYINGEDNLEFDLLEAIKEDFEEFGIFIIDTFEKIKSREISYKIKFSNHGTIERKRNIEIGQFRHYIDNLLDYMYDNTLFIIAGRNSLSDTHLEIDEQRVTELKVDKFNDANIKEYFKSSNIILPKKETIRYIEQITVGNAMLITLFPKIIKEYDNDWGALDFDEIERRMEKDKKYGLLYFLTDRILSHIDGNIELYKLIIPRVLNHDIEKILFRDRKVFDTLIDSGLAYSGEAKEFDRVYLHDSVTSAIIADTKDILTLEYSSYHDNPKIIPLHQKLIEYYQNHHQALHSVNSELEICFHKMMSKENFEKTYNQSREDFAHLSFDSLSLNNSQKLKVCSQFETLSKFQINELIQIWKEESEKLSGMISENLYAELKKYAQRSNFSFDNIAILQEIEKKGEFQNDWSFWYFLGNAYYNKEKFDKAIRAYQISLKINPETDDIYSLMGTIFANDKCLYNEKKAIQYNKKAIEINPKNYLAHISLGFFYDDREQYKQAIQFYKKAIEINPKNELSYTLLAKIYENKKNYSNAIEFYKKAIEINPKNDTIDLHLERLFIKMSKEYQNKFKKICLKRYEAYNDIGVTYSDNKEYNKAIEAYQVAIEIDPNNDIAYYNIGNAYYAKGEFYKASKVYEKAVNINPQYNTYYTSVAGLPFKKLSLDNEIYSQNNSIYTNLFELQLTQDEPFDEVLESKYIEIFQDKREIFIHYEMLKILESIYNNQKYNLSLDEWEEKYQGVDLDWGWNEFDVWIETIKDIDKKAKLLEAVEVFKGHK